MRGRRASAPRRVLLIDGFDPDDPDRHGVDAAVETLERAGHDVTRLCLVEEGFAPAMTGEERAAYHETNNIISDDVARSAALVTDAEALLFCYPTQAFQVPQIVKAWLDRVLLPGVAFVFDNAGRVSPGLTHVERLGVITTRSHSRLAVARARDGGRRTILWTLRLNCGLRCRRTFIAARTGSDATAVIKRGLKRW